MKKPTDEFTASDQIVVTKIHMNESRVNIIGVSPLVPHAVSAKAKGSLLFPAPKKNAAERATSMKHEPLEEYREAAYKFNDADKKATQLYMPAGAFHGSMSCVAVDMAGAKKAQIGRLTKVLGDKVPIWGVPRLWMTVVRSSDMARTPDIRTLPILTEWCCQITVEFVASLIKEASIINLLAAAGQIVGVGDGRPEKGKLSMGCFRLVNEGDEDFKRIQKQATKLQDAALASPDFYDDETEELYRWFEAERKRRSAAPPSIPKGARKKAGESVIIAGSAIRSNGKKKEWSKESKRQLFD